MIDDAAQEEQIHTGIQPYHQQGNGCHSTVEETVIAQMVNIIGIQIGKQNPASRGNQPSRKLGEESRLIGRGNRFVCPVVRKQDIHDGKEQQHD